jgi:hypothetical protein
MLRASRVIIKDFHKKEQVEAPKVHKSVHIK